MLKNWRNFMSTSDACVGWEKGKGKIIRTRLFVPRRTELCDYFTHYVNAEKVRHCTYTHTLDIQCCPLIVLLSSDFDFELDSRCNAAVSFTKTFKQSDKKYLIATI